MTSKWYGNEDKFVALARDLGKSKILGGIEVFENPFKRKLRRKIEINNLEGMEENKHNVVVGVPQIYEN